MPVLDKNHYRKLNRELQLRISALNDAFQPRPLTSNTEGVKGRGYWASPESKCTTIGADYELRLAIDDFKTILSELRKLK